jgi:transglycosylase-like protein with SLT domain
MSVDLTTATASAGDPSRARIAGAIKQAASTTGTSFEYLLTTAKMESDFNPRAVASTSSARGLYQFIDQTWLGTVKEAGPQLGYGKYADAISKSSSGYYSVSDPTARDAILNLRDDPAAASSMAAVLTQSNSFKLTGKIGRRPTDAELYIAHFLGVGNASKLISSAEENPNTSAAAIFPDAAAANPSIFLDRSGRARTTSEVYSVLTLRYADALNSPGIRSTLSSTDHAQASLQVASAAPVPVIDNAAYLSSFPDARSITPTTIASDVRNNSAPTTPIFRSLFQPDEQRAHPVSAVVRELWGNSSSLTSVTPAGPVASASAPLPRSPEIRPPQPFDLFSDRSGTFSG